MMNGWWGPRRKPVAMGACALAWLLVGPAALAGPSSGVLGKTVWQTMQRGGAVMFVILAFSVVGLGLILEALFVTRGSAILPSKTARVLESPKSIAVVDRLARRDPRSCLDRILSVGYRWRNGTTEQIQSAVDKAVDDALWRFRRSLRPLGIIANTAPLLGLLGTVIGIIQAFDVVAQEGALGDPSALAGGISKALLTTCFGLIVAIPMLLTYHYFLGRVETLLHRCEELVKEVLILPPESDVSPMAEEETEEEAEGEA